MKLLYLLHDFLPEHVGGTEVHTAQLAQEFARRGHELVIVCTERDLSRADGTVRERHHDGLRVLEVAHAREYACAEATWEEPLQREVFSRILEQERPNILHVQHFAQWGSGVLELSSRAQVPAFVTLHDFHLLCANACLLREDGALCSGDCGQCLRGLPVPRNSACGLEALGNERRAQHSAHLRLASKVVAPSRFMAALMSARDLVAREQLVQIDSGVQGPWREARASDPGQALRIAYVGGIYPSKGVHILIEAFAKLPSGMARLDLYGVLEWFPQYVNHLRSLAGPNLDLHWHGRFAPEAIDAILDSSDLLVVPSLWYENRPLSIQAAFRRGVPVLASNLGGMAELVESGRGGLLFPVGDALALSRLISTLALDRARLLAIARARPQLPSLAEVADRHFELYAAAASEARPFL